MHRRQGVAESADPGHAQTLRGPPFAIDASRRNRTGDRTKLWLTDTLYQNSTSVRILCRVAFTDKTQSTYTDTHSNPIRTSLQCHVQCGNA